jgi:endonuclease/exonuclease/phosphatase family metal-dependent hydrolase
MIGRIETLLRRWGLWLSRSEWLARLLRLPVSVGTETAPGLVMIQIDGLSHRQLEVALDRGELPFLRHLIEREHYRVHRLYSGVPASTAAFQGELFYGVRQAVPGFGFVARANGNLVRMIEPAAVARVEADLDKRCNAPLLAGGSAYADNFTGGAAESHFCPTARGWGRALREAHPLVVTLLVLSNAYSFLRTLALLALECALAVLDVLRGLVAGHDLIKELKFVPTRVLITILLRELVTIGAKIDVARGLPIVHMNFLGYDEQAHRRGPSSRFAHWSLKGIDDAIARIWRAAHRSARRHYDVWVYSDHGQERMQPYEKIHGRSFAEAVAGVFASHMGRAISFRTTGPWGTQLNRVELLGGRWVLRLVPTFPPWQIQQDDTRLSVTTLGPIAMVYWEGNLSFPERASLARTLVAQARAPLVLTWGDDAQVHGWTDEGEITLPRDGARVLGAGHPYLDEASRDLADLCRHADAGDLIVCGTTAGKPAMTFAIENGAHGGAGAEETAAFALVPADIRLEDSGRAHARAADLRRAALDARSHVDTRRFITPVTTRQTPQRTVRIVTYNVHSCIGMDGKVSPERIARVIARCEADVVALQELDLERPRTGGVDQAHRIAQILDMDFHFHPALHVEEERYGDALLTRLPLRMVRAAALPGLRTQPWLEPRGALWAAVDVDGVALQVINTHLGLLPRERKLQMDALLGEEWLGHPQCQSPRVLCGDFNALPGSAWYRRVRSRLKDAQMVLERHRPKATFFGRLPTARIDYVFVDPELDVVAVEVPNNELARLASDHLPLVVEIRIPPPRPGPA